MYKRQPKRGRPRKQAVQEKVPPVEVQQPTHQYNTRKQQKAKVTSVDDNDISQMVDRNNKPKRGRPRKQEAQVQAPQEEREQPQHRYNTRSKQSALPTNATCIYEVQNVMYYIQQPDGTYLEVYGVQPA